MSDGERPQHEEQEEGDDEVIFDRHAMKRRAFDDLRAKPNAPQSSKGKENDESEYAKDQGDARKVDGAFQLNFTVENLSWKDGVESVVVPQYCLLKIIVSTENNAKHFETAFTFDDMEGTVSETLTPGDSWYYLCDKAGDIEFEDKDYPDLGAIVTVEPIRDDDKALQTAAAKGREKYFKWKEKRQKAHRKAQEQEMAEELKRQKKAAAEEERYEKKAAADRDKSVDKDFNFEVSEADMARQVAVNESVEMYKKMRETKLQG